MTLYKDKLKIDSNRLKNWDYSCEAVYFITMVTKDRECIFGSVEDGKMILNENGKIVENELLKSIKIRKNWFFHNWIVMPNHIHLLIEIQENKETRIETSDIETSQIKTSHIVETHSSASTSDTSTKNETQSMSTHFAETHCCAPLQNQSLPELSNESNLNTQIETSQIKTSQIKTSHIVETHSSASTFDTSTKNETQSMSTHFAETHCCAPLQNQSLPELSNESNLNTQIETSQIKTSQITTSRIVETHSSASTFDTSTKNETQSMSTHFAETHCCAPLQNQSLQTFSRKPNSISSFVAVFKSITTKQINGFETIWQQNYHDHIVRNYKTFETIYDYIKNNPISWETDSINSQLQ
ncbi:transposase [Flavobacterium sp. fv08]|uniref:transposase n=1 Tax=Flavobacterium sp. fv08 TaxID=1761784 RepID=UPI0008D8D5C9|nr:transposase [Flavobacterium sp. fv08]SEO22856.1 hypothetical protein SAMN04487978_2466 [Flavobacterium sp. fv08]